MSSTNLKTFDPKSLIDSKRQIDLLLKEKETQTSKTIMQLAKLDLEEKLLQTKQEYEKLKYGDISPEIHFGRKTEVYFCTENANILQPQFNSFTSNFTLTKTVPPNTAITSSENETPPEVIKHEEKKAKPLFVSSDWSRFTIKEIRVKSVKAPKVEISNVCKEISDESEASSEAASEEHKLNINEEKLDVMLDSTAQNLSIKQENITDDYISFISTDSTKTKDFFQIALQKIKTKDWTVTLKAMTELAERASEVDFQRLYTHMTEINQRLIEILRSPRSHVCRTGCQIAGKFFEKVKDTRRPEFDDIVDILLMKTADSNKFIRKEANCALDSLIMYISPFHSIRAISQKGPIHKNDLVRISSARLFVCIVGISGVNTFLNHSTTECTRQRIFTQMVNFINDKNYKTREYGIRLFKLLGEHQNFDFYLKKLIEKDRLKDTKKVLQKYVK